MDLKEEIRKIVQLQEIDSRIYNFCQEKDIRIPKILEQIRSEAERAKESSFRFEEKLKNIQLTKKDKELDLAAKEENLSKNQAQLYQLKTNKEYQAKLSEIASLKADISLAEEELLKVFEDIDVAKDEFQKHKKELDEKESRLKKQEQEFKDQIKEIEAQTHNLEAKRKSFCSQINKQVLGKYEHLLETRQGLALVPIYHNNCGACHMAVTHQKINALKMFKNLIFCESCVRILYIPDDLC